MKIPHRSLLLCLALSCAVPAIAQTPPPSATPSSATAGSLPEWDKLTPQQRETLIAPLRDRWNSDPQSRAHMLAHGQRWQQMTPQQREQARRGMKRFENMSPEQRERARALFSRMRELSPEQREQLRNQWKKMTPEQRRIWLQQNPPKDGPRDLPPPPAR